MKTAFIIHGAFGNPLNNWSPWLKKELEKRGYSVIVPQFPTPNGQSLSNWLKIIKEYKENINRDTILIGHSIGATFILSVLEQLEEPVNSVYLVSGFISDLGNSKFDEINYSFYNKQFDWEKISKNCFYIFHGDNDPYVPMDKAEQLAEKLQSKVITIPNGGHLNGSAGYTKFELLLDKIIKN